MIDSILKTKINKKYFININLKDIDLFVELVTGISRHGGENLIKKTQEIQQQISCFMAYYSILKTKINKKTFPLY